MDLITLISLIINAFSSYGSIGLVAAAGWGISIYLFWKQNKTRIEWKELVAAKDELIKQKDLENLESKDELAETISKISEQRIEDLKEASDEITELCNKTVFTLDRLTLALHGKDD